MARSRRSAPSSRVELLRPARISPVPWWRDLRFWVLLLLSLGLTLCLIGHGDLYNETDSQYAAAARHMAEGGSWLIPENNGIPRLNKPPLLVWMMSVSFSVGGMTESMARLPTALGICAWVMMTFFLGRQAGGSNLGFVAGLILLTSLGIGTLGRIIMPEPWFCAFLMGALFAGLRFLENSAAPRVWALLFWIACALGAMIKGWHAFVIPLLVLIPGALLCRRRESLLQLLLHWPGWLAAAALNLPWLLLMEWHFPGFLRYFFFDEALGHATGSSGTDTSYENVPRAAFFLLHLAWFFPWILITCSAVAHWKTWRWPTGEAVYFWLWAFVVTGILLLAGQRQDYYGMMGWSIFALATAWVWQEIPQRWSPRFLAAFGGVGLLAAGMFPWWSQWLPQDSATLAERATALTTLGGLEADVWGNLVGWMAIVGAAFFFGGLWAAVLWQKKSIALIGWVLAGGTLHVAGTIGMAQLSPLFSHAPVSRWIQSHAPGARVAYDGPSDTGSSLYFYLGHPVLLVNEEPAPEFAARVHGRGAEWHMSMDDFMEFWRANPEILLVTERLEWPSWQIRQPGAHILHQAADHLILGLKNSSLSPTP
jgi:4-amino-4-deoxy-L-arabinose transferase-like glycosyltransferase